MPRPRYCTIFTSPPGTHTHSTIDETLTRTNAHPPTRTHTHTTRTRIHEPNLLLFVPELTSMNLLILVCTHRSLDAYCSSCSQRLVGLRWHCGTIPLSFLPPPPHFPRLTHKRKRNEEVILTVAPIPVPLACRNLYKFRCVLRLSEPQGLSPTPPHPLPRLIGGVRANALRPSKSLGDIGKHGWQEARHSRFSF